MAKASGDDRILPAMQSFTDQQGVPLVTFARNAAGWTVVQSRYARLGTVPTETRWGIPLCVRQGSERACTLMDGKETTIAVKGTGALMPNAGGTGYYRFELPKGDWDALIAEADRLSGNEALALSDSLKASFLAGRASVAQMAALARKLAKNPDSHASGVALAGLESARAAGLFDAVALKSYRSFVNRIYASQYRKLGINFAAGAYAGEDPERTQTRVAVIETLDQTGKNPQVHTKLLSAATAFLSGDTTALDPMWYGNAFDAWLQGKGPNGARDLLDRALASQDPALRPALLGVIGSSGDKAIGAWVLNEAHDDRLRMSERLNLVRAVIASPGTRDLGYDWLKQHLDDLLGGGAGIFFASRLPQSLAGFCSVERADAIAADLGKRLAGKASELELARTVERVRDCGVLQLARKAEASAAMKAIR
jgi:hypothetical protein